MKKLTLLITSCSLLPTIALASGSFVVAGDIRTSFDVDMVQNPAWSSWRNSDPGPQPDRWLLPSGFILEDACETFSQERIASRKNNYLSYGWNPPDLVLDTNLTSCNWRDGEIRQTHSYSYVDVRGSDLVYQCDQLTDYRTANYFSPITHADSPSICPTEDDEPEPVDPNQACIDRGTESFLLKPVFYEPELDEWFGSYDGCGWYTQRGGVAVILTDDNGVASVSSDWSSFGTAEYSADGTEVSCATRPDLLPGFCGDPGDPGDGSDPSDPTDPSDPGGD